MADTTVTPTDNGPYQVKGSIQLVDAEGRVWETKETVWLCRCGHSSRKPFCDGSHKAANFSAVQRAPSGA